MRLSEILVATTLVAPLVTAHDDHIPGVPKIFGLGAGVNAREVIGFRSPRRAAQLLNEKHLMGKRQQGGTDGRCGPNGGGASCAAGYCCSAEVSDIVTTQARTDHSEGLVREYLDLLRRARLLDRLWSWMRCAQGAKRGQHP